MRCIGTICILSFGIGGLTACQGAPGPFVQASNRTPDHAIHEALDGGESHEDVNAGLIGPVLTISDTPESAPAQFLLGAGDELGQELFVHYLASIDTPDEGIRYADLDFFMELAE